MMGFTLGNGVGRWMNHYGLPADNLVTVNLITAGGDMLQISDKSNLNLMWVLRDIGPNCDIVISAIVKVYPTIDDGQL